VLEEHPEFFKGPSGDFRPGYLLDHLLAHAVTNDLTKKSHVSIDVLWNIVVEGFSGVWPASRTSLDGVSLGDVWPSEAMSEISSLPDRPLAKFPGTESFVCFHKLSQWLTYSLMEPLALAQIAFDGTEKMTGLAEYRNGGLFVDMKVITLKNHIADKFPAGAVPRFEVFDDVIVEWRSLTVSLLDRVAVLVRENLGVSEKDFPLVKILEAGNCLVS
jgi:hypothetical protein